MSGLTPTENEHKEMPCFAVVKAFEEKIAALQDKLNQLSSLQAILRDTEKSNEMAELDLRAVVRQTLALEDDLNQRQFHSQALWARCTSAHNQTVASQLCIHEEAENARAVHAGHSVYCSKMEGHRAAMALAESQRESHRVLVSALNQRKEELTQNLENLNGKTIQEAEREKENLKKQIVVLRHTVTSKREELLKESDTHAQMRKDIEIQNRRYEAILKRLRCQLNKAQANHRQRSGDIHHMESQVAKLRQQLNSS